MNVKYKDYTKKTSWLDGLLAEKRKRLNNAIIIILGVIISGIIILMRWI